MFGSLNSVVDADVVEVFDAVDFEMSCLICCLNTVAVFIAFNVLCCEVLNFV